MPWTRLRVERPSEKDLRRRSDVESLQRPVPFASINHGSQMQTMRGAEPQRRIRDSVVSLSAINDPPVFDEAESPPIQERPPKHHRFSILRFRHASDSQLSKTAKEQADSGTPPMPSRKSKLPRILRVKLLINIQRQSRLLQSLQLHLPKKTLKLQGASRPLLYLGGSKLRMHDVALPWRAYKLRLIDLIIILEIQSLSKFPG